MNGSILGFIVEGLVASLLVATIVYCIILNGKLNHLRKDQTKLRAVIRDLNVATHQAENAIANLKTTVSDAEQDLGERIEEARTITQKLHNQFTEAGGLLGKLSAVSRASHAMKDGTVSPEQAVRAQLWPQFRLSKLAAGKVAPAPSQSDKTGSGKKDVA